MDRGTSSGRESSQRPAVKREGTAVIATGGLLGEINGKTAHGLLRGTERYEILAVVDTVEAGRDAGDVVDGKPLGIPVVATLEEALTHAPAKPDFLIIGCATKGGVLPEDLRGVIEEALRAGLSIVNGLHQRLSDDPQLAALAEKHGGSLLDIRTPSGPPRFWNGDSRAIETPRIAVLGTDCAVGKRTTARFLMEACNRHGIHTQMVTTGQTGWMQGSPHGFIFDAVMNDFVCGELEHAVVATAREFSPDLILIEGQGAFRNPSGPCGAEFIVSAGARGVIFQHAPGRKHFIGHEALGCEIPPIAEDIELARLYGAKTLAVTLNGEGLSAKTLRHEGERLQKELRLPVILPLEDGVDALVPIVESFLAEEAGR